MKRLISMILSIIMVLMVLPGIALATNETERHVISTEEVKLIVSNHVLTCIANDENCTWTINDKCTTTNLYGLDDRIVAFLVSIVGQDHTDNGYVVVCASTNNPCILEYGYAGETPNLSRGNTYYSTMGLYYGLDGSTLVNLTDGSKHSIKDMKEQFDTTWSSVQNVNNASKAQLELLKSDMSTQIADRGSGSWGLITSLPSGTWDDDDALTGCALPSYYGTDDFSGTNHCGPTSGMNVLTYYKSRTGFNLLELDSSEGFGSINSIFSYLYRNMGNGNATLPTSYRSALKDYISTRKANNTSWSSVSISQASQNITYSNLKSNINGGRMPYLVIWNGLEAHYINPVAYYLFSGSNNVYVRVIDNWGNGIYRYYLFRTGSVNNSAITHMGYVQITA